MDIDAVLTFGLFIILLVEVLVHHVVTTENGGETEKHGKVARKTFQSKMIQRRARYHGIHRLRKY